MGHGQDISAHETDGAYDLARKEDVQREVRTSPQLAAPDTDVEGGDAGNYAPDRFGVREREVQGSASAR